MEAFPDLAEYRDCWPIDNFLKSRLKSTSAKWRAKARNEAAAQLLEEAVIAAGVKGKKRKSKRSNKAKNG